MLKKKSVKCKMSHSADKFKTILLAAWGILHLLNEQIQLDKVVLLTAVIKRIFKRTKIKNNSSSCFRFCTFLKIKKKKDKDFPLSIG